MKYAHSVNIPAIFCFALLVACCLLGPACAQQPDSPDAQGSKEAAARLQALEQRVEQLEAKAQARDAQLNALREDLKNVTTYVNLALDNLSAASKNLDDEDGSAGGYARKALKKSLDDLRQAGKGLLEQLERELDQSLGTPPDSPETRP